MKMIEQWVKDLTEKHCPNQMEVGKTLKHPDGRSVKIISGQFWGEHGLSNFWYWREVLPDGTLSETLEHGYGW